MFYFLFAINLVNKCRPESFLRDHKMAAGPSGSSRVAQGHSRHRKNLQRESRRHLLSQGAKDRNVTSSKTISDWTFCGIEACKSLDCSIPLTGAAIVCCRLLISIVSDTRDLMSVKTVHNVYTLSGNSEIFVSGFREGGISNCILST